MARLGNGLVRGVGRIALGLAAAAATAALVVPAANATPESDAADAIGQAWDAAGGSDSVVGGQDGDLYQVGDGYARKFTDGKIFFDSATGAHLIYGAILNKYESFGGPADSDLGFPAIDEVAGLVGPNSRVSTFSASDKPAIFWTSGTGAWAVRGAVNAAWDKLGGSAGTLGVPVEDERYDGDVVSQKFTGGELTWNFVTKTFTTEPAGLADELAGLEVPSDAASEISQVWRASGGLGGPLGARQGQQSAIGDSGTAQGYAGGKIYFSAATGAHAATGAILSKYESLGGATGDLGYPIGTEADGGAPNSRVSAFSAPDRPVIFWTPDSGAIVVRGAINAAWAKLGGATGMLGAPSEEQTVKGDTVTQKFSGGQISWNQASGDFSTNPAELAASLAGLELPDAIARAPIAVGAAETGNAGGFQWWWLLIIVPSVLLLGLLAMWAQRRSATSESDSDASGFDGDNWSHGGRDFASDADGGWSAPAKSSVADESFNNDEDAIDTAPTRIPSEAELGEYAETVLEVELEEYVEAEPADFGRHSAVHADSESSMWRLDLDEVGWPRRRHAAEDAFEPDFDVDADLPEQQFEPVQQVDELWRPAIHLPLADPYQPPEGYVVKANTHSGLYYTPASALYENTVPEVWFANEELAQANGFVRSPQ